MPKNEIYIPKAFIGGDLLGYAGRFRKGVKLVSRFFRILDSDIIKFTRFSDVVVVGVISFTPYLKCPAYPDFLCGRYV